ncbi:MAG: hypothetical protein L0209_12640 [candidate division Zixibacteria bacterium]|nr:hypothetical protein [candidate division Zixibacteria bacterium]
MTVQEILIAAVNSGTIKYTSLEDHGSFENIEEMVEFISEKSIRETLKDFRLLADNRRDIHEVMAEVRLEIARDLGITRR